MHNDILHNVCEPYIILYINKWAKDPRTFVRANLTRNSSPPNSTLRRFPSYLLLTFLLYFLLIFHLPRCTLLNFPSVSSLTSLPFLSCCHRTATTWYIVDEFVHHFYSYCSYKVFKIRRKDLEGKRGGGSWEFRGGLRCCMYTISKSYPVRWLFRELRVFLWWFEWQHAKILSSLNSRCHGVCF